MGAAICGAGVEGMSALTRAVAGPVGGARRRGSRARRGSVTRRGSIAAEESTCKYKGV